jgi:starvation-inducible DNA-binding protein
VTGALFQSLHLTFENQYLDLAEAVDLIAERIRALGFPVHATYRDFSKLTSIQESEDIPGAKDMVRELVESHEIVIKNAREICQIAEQANDQATLELLVARLCVHEKAAWMLRSSLE